MTSDTVGIVVFAVLALPAGLLGWFIGYWLCEQAGYAFGGRPRPAVVAERLAQIERDRADRR